MELLAYATACSFTVGPVRNVDGYTLNTSLTVTNITMIKIAKEAAAALTDISANAFTHLANGVYKQALSAADTNTLGKFEYHLGATTAVPEHREFMVVPANVYNSLVLGTDLLDINIDQINQVSTPANNLRMSVTAIVVATVQAGSSTSIIETNLTAAVNDHYKGRTILFTSGTLANQASEITGYNGTTKEITCAVLTSAPANGDTFVIV